jgi:hypothetical protein
MFVHKDTTGLWPCQGGMYILCIGNVQFMYIGRKKIKKPYQINDKAKGERYLKCTFYVWLL